MNIRRGILRLALVLSVLAGIIFPITLLEKYPWTTYKVLKFELGEGKWYAYEFKWTEKGIAPIQLVKTCVEIDRENEIVGELEGFPKKTGKRLYPLNYYRYEIEKKADQFFEGRKPDEWREHIKVVDITTNVNWNRFFLTMLISFTSVWVLYAFVRLVVVAFILEGFKNKSSRGGGPE